MLLAVVVVVVVGGDCYCAACTHFGALFSRQRSFFLYCDMYLRFRACAVVLDIELSVSAWYQRTQRVLLRARRLLLLLLEATGGGVRHKFQNYMQWSETKQRFCANQNTRKSRRIQNTPA